MRTMLVLTVFTAFAALTLRWCDSLDGVLQFQTDSRTRRGTQGTVGYLASNFFLRITLEPEDTFKDLIGQVTTEYCQALEHADFGYLEASVPRLAVSRNSGFNWIP